MTNFEKWQKILLELKWDFASINGEPCHCDSISCRDCLFEGCCSSNRWYWLWKLFKEPTDTPDKQIPQKPILAGDYKGWYCPTCDKYYTKYERHNYCPNCGQRIDWEEEEC